MKTEKRKRTVEWGMAIGLSGCTQEASFPLSEVMDEEEFDALSEEEQQEALSDFAQEQMWNYLDTWAIVKG